MPEVRLLVQMGSLQHRWIPNRDKSGWLVTMIDDTDGYVYLVFYLIDINKVNIRIIKSYILKWGHFIAFYTDKAFYFKILRQGSFNIERLFRFIG